MQYGYFDDSRREYVITRPDTPAPWANYLGSPEYGALISNFTGGLAMGMRILMGSLTVVILAAAGYVFPLIARYENSLRQHLLNALILAVAKLPRTLCIVVLNALPAAQNRQNKYCNNHFFHQNSSLQFIFFPYYTTSSNKSERKFLNTSQRHCFFTNQKTRRGYSHAPG